MADYLPTKDDELSLWIPAFLDQLPILGAVVGVTTAEQAQLGSLGNAATGGITNVVTKKNAYDSALANREELVAGFSTVLRPIVRRMKTNASYTETIGMAFGIVAHSTPVDPALIKPVVFLTPQFNSVRVRVNRDGAETVNLYMRRQGQPNWTLLQRLTRSTYDDLTPLAVPGVPEVRDYMAQGFIGNEQVGQASDPKVVVYAGALAA